MKKLIVISAINIRSGGALSILQDSLSYLHAELLEHYRVIALVHDRSLLKNINGITLIEFPQSTRSYFHRLYFEYFYFNKLSKQWNVFLWLSLHDMTPNVSADIRAVYCHNPLPFYKLSLKEKVISPKLYMFSLLYQYVYKINLKNNNMIIVQQSWIRKAFVERFKLNIQNVIVAYPNITQEKIVEKSITKDEYQFFFPTLSRVFKNIEVIIDAVRLINKINQYHFKVTVTIDGTENKYARYILKYASEVKNFNFIGKISRNKVNSLYAQSDCLIFPSKLETWGLPITEFKLYKKPILAVDLPYAHETLGQYRQANFFEAENAQQLANLMQDVMSNKSEFMGNEAIKVNQPYVQNWSELFHLLLKGKADVELDK